MLITALSTFTAFTGEMRVFNRGDQGELPDAMALTYINSGQALPGAADLALSQLDHDGDGQPGGSLSMGEDPEALGDARKRYRAAFGKGAGPRWTVDVIEAKLAEHAAATADSNDDDASEDDFADAPPAA